MVTKLPLRKEIRFYTGEPPVELFTSAGGSPLVVDLLTGYAYYLDENGEVQRIMTSPVLLGKGDMLVDAWGTQKMSLPRSLFHGLWTFDIPASMWFMYESGAQVYTSTAITSTEGTARIAATAAQSELLLESRECPRYQPNRGIHFAIAGWFPNKTADGVRDFGLFTAENGAFFRLKADGLLYAVLRRGGVEVLEELIDTSGILGFDIEKNFTYDIQAQWRSAGNYNFFIGDPETGFAAHVHEFDLLGTLTSTSIENPALPMAFKVTRTGEDLEMRLGCVDLTSENGRADFLQFGSSYATGVSTAAAETPNLVLFNPLTIGGKINTRSLQLGHLHVSASKKALFKIWTTRDATAFTGMTLQALGNGSFVQTDSPAKVAGAVRATAVTTSKLRHLGSVSVEAAGGGEFTSPLPGIVNMAFVRGDYLVVTCVSTPGGTSDVSLEFGEDI